MSILLKYRDIFNLIKEKRTQREKIELLLSYLYDDKLETLLKINYCDRFSYVLSSKELLSIPIYKEDYLQQLEIFLLNPHNEKELIRLFSFLGNEEREVLISLLYKKLRLGIKYNELSKLLDIRKIRKPIFRNKLQLGDKYFLERERPNSLRIFIEKKNKIRDFNGRIIYGYNPELDNQYNIVYIGYIETSTKTIYLTDAIPYNDFYDGYSSCKLFSRKRILRNYVKETESLKINDYAELEYISELREIDGFYPRYYYGEYICPSNRKN